MNVIFLKHNQIHYVLFFMIEDKNEIDKLIDTMISNGNDLVGNFKNILPESLADTMEMFQESNVANLKKIKEFLNK